ncbi:DNA/RNA polymerases superfamily protein [Gossypium australe]|uniref:DNA/RNA polymerases superfamily protein n=1 Tax=Gossypium australe TaxID=47621 RepID=A0A5B6VCD9_9ROSI|nr:DNA/RNA polymerases superfamily protein [Gossypium australe]
MAPCEALYGRKFCTPLCWIEFGERKVLGPELVFETEDKVAFDREKSYVDPKRKDIDFEVRDRVFLKFSPWKKVLRFVPNGKLSPRFIGPYQILRRVRTVAYQLELPPKLDQIHDAFHMSMLRRYRFHPYHVVLLKEIELRSNLSFEKKPVQILDPEVKVLRRKTIQLVKVLWRNYCFE